MLPAANEASVAGIAVQGAALGAPGPGGGGGGARGYPVLWAPAAATAAAAAGADRNGPGGEARFRMEDMPLVSGLVRAPPETDNK